MFAEENRQNKLSAPGDCLERLKVIDWELFRPDIEEGAAQGAQEQCGKTAVRLRTAVQILVVQRLYNLSDDQTEFQINDRISFMRFLRLGLSSKVPDAKTIRLFRDTLTQSGVITRLFRLFESQLEAKGLITHKRHKSAAKTVRTPIFGKKQIEP